MPRVDEHRARGFPHHQRLIRTTKPVGPHQAFFVFSHKDSPSLLQSDIACRLASSLPYSVFRHRTIHRSRPVNFRVTFTRRSARLSPVRWNTKALTSSIGTRFCKSQQMTVLGNHPEHACKAVATISEGRPTVLDLFCGVGGFSLGAVRAGFRLVGGVDWDRDALRMHSVNFPNSPHWQTDLSQTSAQDLRDRFRLEQVDGIIGGPPCQGFSRMGHQRVDDSRNGLFVKFFALVADLKPKFFLAENVPGLLDIKNVPLVDHALSFVYPDYNVSKPIILTASPIAGAPPPLT